MKVLLIVNSSASGVSARSRVVVQRLLGETHDVDVAETNRRGHAIRLAQGAVVAGTELVVTLGGDGTVNEVANGLARSKVPMAVLPGGSTNVFARTLGFANEPVKAVHEVVAALESGSVRRIGLGYVNGRFFCFHVGLGYDAAVVREVEKHPSIKRWLGHPLFIYSALVTWARRYDRTSPAFTIDLGTGRPPLEGLFSIVMNSDPYTYLGPRALSLIPEATLDAPLGIVNLRSLGARATIGAITAALRGDGRLARRREVDIVRDLMSFSVRGHRPFPWQVDGDHLGDAVHLQFRYEPACLTVVLPVGPGTAAASEPDRLSPAS